MKLPEEILSEVTNVISKLKGNEHNSKNIYFHVLFQTFLKLLFIPTYNKVDLSHIMNLSHNIKCCIKHGK